MLNVIDYLHPYVRYKRKFSCMVADSAIVMERRIELKQPTRDKNDFHCQGCLQQKWPPICILPSSLLLAHVSYGHFKFDSYFNLVGIGYDYFPVIRCIRKNAIDVVVVVMKNFIFCSTDRLIPETLIVSMALIYISIIQILFTNSNGM